MSIRRLRVHIKQTKQQAYLECELGSEGELVALEQPSGGVHEHGVGDAVNQVEHASLDLLGRFCTIYGLVEHHAECLINK